MVFIKIITIITLVFLILLMLSLISPLVVFIVPIMVLTFVFVAVASIAGMIYYRHDPLLLCANLAVLLTMIPLNYLLYDHLWLFRLWTAATLAFYGYIVFTKQWVL